MPIWVRGKIYYEGIDHSEAYLMMRDFLQSTGNDPMKVMLVNIDADGDISDGRYISGQVRLGIWIRSVKEKQFYNNDIGMYWIYRNNPDLVPLEEGVFAKTMDDYARTGVKVHLMDMEAMATDPLAKELLTELYAYKQRGYTLLVSIDSDAGQMEEPDPSYDKDLFSDPQLHQLYQAADGIMFFHSPEYSNPIYSRNQAKQFRRYMLSLGV